MMTNAISILIRRLFGRGGGSEVRLVLVVRKDAGLTSGLVASHCAEAAINSYKTASLKAPRLLQDWESFGVPKVVLKVKDSAEMNSLLIEAAELKILSSRAFESDENNPTVIGLGPNRRDRLDRLTSQLKLL